MTEQTIHFTCDHLEIEGRLAPGKSGKGVVITHPHPLYGGEMHNPVVEAIMQAYQQKAYTTLRFNFRGVGNSQGFYDNGIGEQQDVLAALTYLHQQGIQQLELAGYSFGAWIAALVCAQPEWNHPFDKPGLVMISPPVGFLDFSSIDVLPTLKLVVTGLSDEIVPADFLQAQTPRWNENAVIKLLQRADHFYTDCIDRLRSVVFSHI